MIRYIGYACINNTLAIEKVQVNRGMVKRTFQAKGIPYASELALRNVLDLERIVDWNIATNILLFRMSSDMFPRMSEYELRELPAYKDITAVLAGIGNKAGKAGMRLTFHPGPFNVLASANPAVIEKTSKELRQHAEIMDWLGLPETPDAKINIHIGGAYGNKSEAILRFVKNYRTLPLNVQSRLTVENDDKPNLFSVSELNLLHESTGIPVVFDYLHHQFCSGGLSEEEAFSVAIKTWPAHIVPVVHYSSSRRRSEDAGAPETAHADYVYEQIRVYNTKVDVMLEAKAKESAVEKYLQQFGTG